MNNDWLKNRNKKRETTRYKSGKDEKSAGKKFGMKQTKSSGSVGIRKGDLWDSSFCLETKVTGKKSYALSREELDKLFRYSCEANVIPFFRVTFNQPTVKSFVIIEEEDFKRLKEGYIE